MKSYRYWDCELKRADFTFGQFAENFTVEGLADNEVCVGDRYRIGNAVFEVTQPHVTCYYVGIRMDEPRMAALLVAHYCAGFDFFARRKSGPRTGGLKSPAGTSKIGDPGISEQFFSVPA